METRTDSECKQRQMGPVRQSEAVHQTKKEAIRGAHSRSTLLSTLLSQESSGNSWGDNQPTENLQKCEIRKAITKTGLKMKKCQKAPKN